MSNEKKQAAANAADEAQAIREHNLRFYNKGCEVPADALKSIQAGRLKGMSDVNPMWRMKRMTEIFGPVGFGWKYTIDRQWVEEYVTDTIESKTPYQPQVPAERDERGKVIKEGIAEKHETTTRTRNYEVKCFCNVSLYVRDPETKEWSAAIPGNGGSAIVSKERGGAYVNDEGYKMALSDALSIAMKPLGIGGNIWYGPKANGHNESKYEAATRPESTQSAHRPAATSGYAYTGEQLNAALTETQNCTTIEQLNAVWHKWGAKSPALCQPGTDFYKAIQQKNAALNKAAN